MAEYTERVDGFQIRDVSYFGKPPAGSPPRYDVVKWEQFEPHECMCYENGKLEKRMVSEHCYSVGMLEWNQHEGDFDFQSVGLRWLEARPSDAVIDMILNFCKKERQKFVEYV